MHLGDKFALSPSLITHIAATMSSIDRFRHIIRGIYSILDNLLLIPEVCEYLSTASSLINTLASFIYHQASKDSLCAM